MEQKIWRKNPHVVFHTCPLPSACHFLCKCAILDQTKLLCVSDFYVASENHRRLCGLIRLWDRKTTDRRNNHNETRDVRRCECGERLRTHGDVCDIIGSAYKDTKIHLSAGQASNITRWSLRETWFDTFKGEKYQFFCSLFVSLMSGRRM